MRTVLIPCKTCGVVARRPAHTIGKRWKGNCRKCAMLKVRLLVRQKPTRMSDCHPTRKHFGKGLCQSCWFKDYYETRYKDKRKAYSRKWYEENKSLAQHYRTQWRINNRDHVNLLAREWRQRNINRVRQREKESRKTLSQNYRIGAYLRHRMRSALKSNTKSDSALRVLGCSITDFKIYLESKFEPGMSWENYGKVWHIDHIMPCAIFDLSKPDHQKRCFHFSNLQPLFAVHNLRKGAKIVTNQYRLI